jgi:hypothetical protein
LDVERINKLTLNEITWQNNSLTVSAELIDVDASGITDYGICYAINEVPDLNNGTVISKGTIAQPSTFNIIIPQVQTNQIYFFRAFVVSNNKVTYSNVNSVNTIPFSFTLLNDSVIIYNSTNTEVVGRILNIGSLKIKEFGFLYSSIYQQPNVFENKIIVNKPVMNGELTFKEKLPDLNLDTNYFICTYLTLHNNITYYSNVRNFKVKTHKLFTSALTKVNNELIMLGRFNQVGVDSISEYGFCWSNSTPLPNINNNRIKIYTQPQHLVSFTHNYIKTNADTLPYYVRTYVIYDNKVIYGNTVNTNY